MRIMFLLTCYLVGIVSTLGLGPMFILTFNRGALYGFLRGFATALGAAIADGILFALGITGFLAFFGESKKLYLALDLGGGILLISMGIYYFRKMVSFRDIRISIKESVLSVLIQSFFLTLINPGAIIYFAYMGMQVMEGIENLGIAGMFFGVLMVALGTLTSFTIVSLMASRIGSTVTETWLSYVSKGAGILLMLIGLYFLYDLVQNSNWILSWLTGLLH